MTEIGPVRTFGVLPMDARDALALDDFQHRPADYLAHLRESGRPVVLTVDGKAALVVQDAASYQKLVDLAEEATVLDGVRRGLDDVKAGRTRPLEEAFTQIRRDLGLSPGA
jgi:prevent-host-death family protein